MTSAPNTILRCTYVAARKTSPSFRCVALKSMIWSLRVHCLLPDACLRQTPDGVSSNFSTLPIDESRPSLRVWVSQQGIMAPLTEEFL